MASVPQTSGRGTPGQGLAVEIRGLDITFATDGGDVHAVRDVSLDVRPGEVLAIVGESGSGKTVTARSILGLLPETATTRGAVVLAGTDVVGLSADGLRAVRGTKAAMIFQEPSTALNPVHTVGWQLAEGLRAHGAHSKQAAKAKAIEMLGRVGIPDPERRVNDYPHQFSGGQKQRIVIAMALALGPGVILADEPTTALDVTVQAEILDLLRQLRDETGTAIVLITHNMGVVADLADRVAVMLEGELVETGGVEEIFRNPQHEYTKKLLAAVPRVQLVDRPLPAVDAGASASAAGAAASASVAEPVVEAKGLVIEYPGRLGSPTFRAEHAI
ncbi:MAG TPA: ABC transporter ATP-binding protein, partial [Microbacterium sp.]|nr:ABC transporter ATP-binding protein [Microbacterium sp.]